MAFKEVTTEQGEGAAGGEFFNFKAIGDKLEGYFVATKKTVGGQFTKADDMDYSFLCKGDDGKPVVKVASPPPTDAKRKLAKALREGQLVQGVAVRMTYTGDLDVGQDSKMKVIKTLIEIDDAGKPIVKAAAVEAIKKYQPVESKPKPKSDDSLFGDAGGDDDIPF